MIRSRRMERSEINRIAEIDRSEHVTTGYAVREGKLVAETVDWKVPPWSREGDGPHTVADKVKAWRRHLQEEAGAMFGAFDGDLLVGVAIVRPRLSRTMAQLAVLHVSRAYRRQGVATRLMGEALRVARESGAESIYVSAAPSESAVGFYQSHGFEPTPEPHPELFEEEPEDIHMTKRIR